MLENPDEIKKKITEVIEKVMEQFLENTHKELKIYLKEKNPKTREEMAEFTNRWTEITEEVADTEIFQHIEYNKK